MPSEFQLGHRYQGEGPSRGADFLAQGLHQISRGLSFLTWSYTDNVGLLRGEPHHNESSLSISTSRSPTFAGAISDIAS